MRPPIFAFKNRQHAREFFEQVGFKITPHNLGEVIDELSTVDELGLNRDKVRDQILNREVWALEPK